MQSPTLDQQDTEPSVAVIIPFFQRESGLLTRAVDSVLSQESIRNIEVVVVDDGSPICAEAELESIQPGEHRVRIIKQKNGGPGAARNVGLDSIGDETDYVAFLDSDDSWDGLFLSRAVLGLESGADVFFGNTRRYEREGTRFDWSRDPRTNLDAADHVLLDQALKVYQFRGEFFDFAIFRSSVISTSSLVYRRRPHCELRFDPTLFNGQDRLFKLALSRVAAGVAFTPEVCAIEGKGVNIFDSAGWGTDRSLRLASSYVQLARKIIDQFPLNDRQYAFVRSQLSESRKSIAANVLNVIRRRGFLDLKQLARAFRADPGSAILFLPNVIEILMSRFMRKSDRSI